ncbi:MAG: winged helix-turn-helix transcriptional regulator [Sulfolobales archaeon]
MKVMRFLPRFLVVVMILLFISEIGFSHDILRATDNLSTRIIIGSDGVALVFINVSLSQGIQEVRVPTPPIPATIIARSDSEILPVIYDSGFIILILDKPSNVSISYVANTSIENNLFILDIETNDTIELIIPLENIVVLTLPINIVSYEIYNNTLDLILRGPQEIKYTLRVGVSTYTTTTPPTTTTTTTEKTMTPPVIATASPTTTPVTTETSITSSQNIFSQYLPLILFIVLIVIVGVLSSFIMMRRRFYGKGSEILLDDLDREIIRIIGERGGSIMQSELQDMIKAPRTTLWRHIKRLERLGIVRVEKVGVQNRIILIKKI